MSNDDILDIYNEYQNLLTLLNGKPFILKEKSNFIEIRLNSEFDIDLISKIGEKIEHFNLYCNPHISDFDEVLDEMQRGIITIKDVDSLSIRFDKESILSEMKGLNYIFFEESLAVKALKEIQHKNEKKHKLNIGIFKIISFETELLNFINIDENLYGKTVQKKEVDSDVTKHLNFYLSNNRGTNQNYFYNPYAFVIKEELDINCKLKQLVKSEFYETVLGCISDKEEDKYLVIRGEKNILIYQDEEFSTNNYLKLIDIFLFLISQKKYTEKYIIIKRVITLYLQDKDTISKFDEKLAEIWKTINHYYNHYIEDNIKDFFKTKDQLLKEAMNASKIIYDQTDKITNSIVVSIISILILLVTTLFRSLENVNSALALIFLTIFLIFSVLFYKLMKKSSVERYNLIEDQFNHFISEISLLQKKEVSEIKKTYLKKPYNIMISTLKKLKIFLIIVNVILIVSYLIFICYHYTEINNFQFKIEFLIAKCIYN